MDHHLSHEYAELQKTVAAFAHDVIAPVIGDLYEARAFPYDIVRQMGEMGLFGLPIPEEYGGMGGDYFALCLTLEEIARVDSSVAITLEAAVSLGAMPIYRFGTEEQKRTWLPRLVTASGWEPFAFVDLCEVAESDAELRSWCEEVQFVEMLLLLESTYLSALC